MKRKICIYGFLMTLFYLVTVSAFAQPAPGKDPDSPKGEMCAGGNNSITSSLSGSNYQWQVNKGAGFENISDNVYYNGTSTKTLQLIKIPSSWYGYILKVIVDGTKSETYPLTFVNTWTGTKSAAWEDAANWSCGVLPDPDTDVIIYSGSVMLSSNVTVRSLTINPAVSFNVNSGFKLTIKH